MRVFLGVLILLACLAAAITGFLLQNGSSNASEPAVLDHSRPRPQAGVYVNAYPIEGAPEHLNPFTTTAVFARRLVLRYTHDNLMWIDPDTGELQSGIASAEEVSPDGTEILFALRDDARFSNGDPVTLQDVLFTWQACTDRKLAVGSIRDATALISTMVEAGPRRFRMRLRERPFGGFADVVLDYPIVQRKYYLAQMRELARKQGRKVAPTRPGDEGFGELMTMIRLPGPGTGPYRLRRETRGALAEGFELEQNPHAWHRRADTMAWNLAGMRFVFMSRDAQFVEMRKGKVDWWAYPDARELHAKDPEIQARYVLHDYDYYGSMLHMLVWNHRRPKLQNAKVRKALTMLLDRQQFVQASFAGLGTVIPSCFTPGRPGAPTDIVPWPFDEEAAKKLLQEAGYGGDGQPKLELEILLIHGMSQHRQMLTHAGQAFRASGVALSAKPVERSVFNDRREKADFDGFMLMWNFGRSAAVDPYAFFHSSGSQNFAGYHNSEVDGLLEAARSEANAVRRNALYQQFNRIFHEEQPVTMLVHPRNTVLLHKRFKDAKPGVLGLVPRLWWVEK